MNTLKSARLRRFDSHMRLDVEFAQKRTYEFRYEKRPWALIYPGDKGFGFRGEDGCTGSFFAYTAPGRGFCGAKFTLQMLDGTTEELVGPWSSRPSCINALFAAREPLVDACEGSTSVIANVRLDALVEWMTQNPHDFDLVLAAARDNEQRYVPWPQGQPFTTHGEREVSRISFATPSAATA